MGIEFDVNPRWLQEREIDFSKLDPNFRPHFQKEKDCYKKAIIHNGRDAATGRKVKDTAWTRDSQPGELAYERWLKEVTDENMKYYPAKDKKGNPIEGTGARHIVTSIIRIKTPKGEFLVSDGKLQGYDHFGNLRERTCRHPEEWFRTDFNFVRGFDSSTGQSYIQCTGPAGGETVYEMPFNKENLRALVKLVNKEDGNNNMVSFVLKNCTNDSTPKGIPHQGSLESTMKFFMQDFDYLYNAKYLSNEDKAWNKKVSELILSGKAQNEQDAAEIAEIETEEKKPPSRKDSKTGVA